MEFLKKCLIYSFLYFQSYLALSDSIKTIEIKNVDIVCQASPDCSLYQKANYQFKTSYKSYDQLNETLKLWLAGDDIKHFKYVIEDSSLKIELKFNPIIKQIKLEADPEIQKIFNETMLSLKQGQYFDVDDVKTNSEIIKTTLLKRGVDEVAVDFKIDQKGNEVDIVVVLRVLKRTIVSNVTYALPKLEPYLDYYIKEKFNKMIGLRLDKVLLKEIEQDIMSEFLKLGYYFANINLEIIETNTTDSILNIKLTTGRKYLFKVEPLNSELSDLVLEYSRNFIKSYNTEVSGDILKEEIQKFCQENGYYQTGVNVLVQRYSTALFESSSFNISLKPGHKSKINKVSFRGNKFFSNDHLEDLFFETDNLHISSGNFVTSYLDDFLIKLKDEYLKNGFVFVNIGQPSVSFSDFNETVDISYFVKEGIQNFLEKINISGLEDIDENDIKDSMINKESAPLNPLSVNADIESVISKLKSLGYYYAKMTNKNFENLITYNREYTKSQMNLVIELGPKVHFNEFIVIGNIETRTTTILKELLLEKGQIITPQLIDDISQILNSYGIFNSIRISLIPDYKSGYFNILLRLSEKKFGFVEVAPGFRTDLGLKLSTRVGHNNLWGRRRAATFSGQINQRFDNSSFDDRRKAEGNKKLENEEDITYYEPFLFGRLLSFQSSVSHEFKRLYSFDADIFKMSLVSSKDFTKHFSGSLRYQLEGISQTDASNEKDNGFFRVGSLTPGISFDFRNNKIRPTKGIYSDLSTEFANPLFYSMDRNDLEINFMKTVWRNRAYIPVPFGTIAMSVSVGHQKNLSDNYRYDANGNRITNEDGVALTEGYIPSIKVFRLNGADNVRGFKDGEINILNETGEDINRSIIQGEVYYISGKFEPRYHLSDTLTLGVFLDGGGIYLDKFRPTKFRSSAGLSFKYETPVGSMDFEYGFKLHRKQISNGALESPGRFQVSIGFF